MWRLRSIAVQRLTFLCALLFAIGSISADPPPIPPEFIDGRTLGLVIVDLEVCDATIARESITQIAGESVPPLIETELAWIEKLMTDVSASGARAAAFLWVGDDNGFYPPRLRIALGIEPEDDAGPVRDWLMAETHSYRAPQPDENEGAAPPVQTVSRFGDWLTVAQVDGAAPIDGNVAAEARRAWLIEALASTAPRPIRIIVAFGETKGGQDTDPYPGDDPMRQFEWDMNRLQWISGSLSPGATPQAQFTLMTPAADCAMRIVAGMRLLKDHPESSMGLNQGSQAESLVKHLWSMLNARQQGRIVFIDVDTSKAPAIARLAPLVIDEQKEREKRMRSMSNMRQSMMAVQIYLQTHDNEWPDSLDDLIETGYISDETLINPLTGEKRGYVYVKPDRPFENLEEPGKVGVIYELHDGRIDPDGAVAFADGHVEVAPEDDR